MAFQDVNNNTKASGEGVKLTGLAIGDSVTGYVVTFRPSLQNPDNMNIFMRDEDGPGTFYVYTAGNLKYLIKDGKIKEGLLTKITRIADKMVGGMKSSQFQVLQDPEQKVDVSEEASFAAITSSSTDTSSSAAVKQATERASIKAQAAKLSQAVRK
jgi:hypothetical protein